MQQRTSSSQNSLFRFAVAILAGTCFFLNGCSKSKPPKAKPSDSGSVESGPTTTTEPTEDGVPVMRQVSDFVLLDQFGRPSGLREMHAHMCVVHFIFTRCTETCPDQMARLVQLAKDSENEDWWRHTQFVSMSVDEYDTPEVLKEFSGKWSAVDDPHWVYLTGSRSAMTDICQHEFLLPVSAKENEPITHSQKFALVDPVGRIRGFYDSADESAIAQLKVDMQSVWDEQLPFVSEVLDSEWMSIRRDAQLAQADSLNVRHDFRFEDRQQESGIRFLHQVVDDAGRDYKPVHYDHGNGITIADVDNDGWHDIYFTNQVGANALYRNLGGGRFEDITFAAGVEVADRISVSAAFADIDNDGDADLYVTTVKHGNLMFENDGQGHFQDITNSSGLGYTGHSSGALFFDYDRDGKLDLFLCNVGVYTTEDQGADDYFVGFKDAFSGHLKPKRTESSRLFRNVNGKSFEDVTESAGLIEGSWTGDAVILDGNRDGWPDLYVLDMQGNDEYFENQQGKTFVKRSRELFPKTPWGAMGVAVADFDNDQDFDVFITDMHSDMSKDIMADARSEASLNTFFNEEKLKATMQLPESLLKSEGHSIYGNAFFRNDGADQFTEVSDKIGAENYWPWGLSAGDLNADGFEDVFIASSMNFPFRYAINSVLLNDGGTQFVDSEFILNVEPRDQQRTAQPWFSMAADAPENDISKRIRKTSGKQGATTVWGALGTRSSVLFDLDLDGDLDIVTGEFNDVPMVLISNLADSQSVNSLRIHLVGTQSNRQAIGAQVTATAGGKKLLRAYDGKTGYLSQGHPDLYVGLGADKADSIEIVWPSGKKQTVAGPFEAGKRIEITEPN